MNEIELKKIIEEFLNSTQNKMKISGVVLNERDLKSCVESMNGYYDENLNESMNSNNIFYLRKGYDIITDESIIWIGKIIN